MSRSIIGDTNGSDRWLPVALLIIFVLAKIPYLNNPFYWDEAWVYGPAIFEMSQGTPSIFPGKIDVELSRGHPLLFHFLGGLFLKIFGSSLLTAHLFALSVSVVCLGYFYKLSRLFLNPSLSIIATIFLAANEVFFVQSTMVLPEVMLCCFFLASLYYFYKENTLLLFLSLTAMVWTKETGIVFVLSFLLLNILELIFNKAHYSRSSIKAIVGSLFMFLLFFIFNKIEYGWFLFPEHTGMMESQAQVISSKLKELYALIFSNKGHWTLLIAIPVLIYMQYKQRMLTINVIILLISLLSLCLFNNYPKSILGISICYLIMLLSSLVIIIKTLQKQQYSVDNRETILLWIALNAFILFSALNFLTGRYILIAVPILIILSFQVIQYVTRHINSKFQIVLILPFTIATIVNLIDNDSIGDTDLGHVGVIACQKKIAQKLSTKVQDDDSVKVDFLLKHHFNNPDIGYYLDEYPKINLVEDAGFDYYIYHDLVDKNGNDFISVKNDHHLELIDECILSYYKVQLYANKRNTQ